MKTAQKHSEMHKTDRISWLRAAVLGANDGIVSTASLIVGVTAANSTRENILITGLAGLVAGAMSMAAGEYVSVSSQADTEEADLEIEKQELESNIEFEREELAQIYVDRGLDLPLARQVADQLMAKDPLGSHARDELGITEIGVAHPIQAAAASAASFSMGAFLPLLTVWVSPFKDLLGFVSAASIISLILLGIISAVIGGASPLKAALRVGFWGALAMIVTALIGFEFGLSTP